MILNVKTLTIIYILNSLITGYAYQEKLSYLIVFCNLLSFGLLSLYYKKSVKKVNKLFVFVLGLIFLSEIFFNLNNKIVAYVLSFISRNILLYLVVKNSLKIDKRTLSIIVVCFSIIGVIILSLPYYVNNILFILSVLIAITLVVLASVLFTNLLKKTSQENIDLFFGVFILIVADAIFVLLDLDWSLKQIVYTLIFQTSYYLLCRGMIGFQKR